MEKQLQLKNKQTTQTKVTTNELFSPSNRINKLALVQVYSSLGELKTGQWHESHLEPSSFKISSSTAHITKTHRKQSWTLVIFSPSLSETYPEVKRYVEMFFSSKIESWHSYASAFNTFSIYMMTSYLSVQH